MMTMIRYHEPTDNAKVEDIAASLEANGWQGAPLVVIGDELVTGAHRHAAYVTVFGGDDDLPVIELAEVFAEAGLDLETVMADEGCDCRDDASFVYVCDALPYEVAEKYGVDVH